MKVRGLEKRTIQLDVDVIDFDLLTRAVTLLREDYEECSPDLLTIIRRLEELGRQLHNVDQTVFLSH